MAEDRSEDKEDITVQLDQVIPKHKLLDNTAANHTNDLVHRGILASRHCPSGEGLRAWVVRTEHTDSMEGYPVRTSQHKDDSPPEDDKGLGLQINMKRISCLSIVKLMFIYFFYFFMFILIYFCLFLFILVHICLIIHYVFL